MQSSGQGVTSLGLPAERLHMGTVRVLLVEDDEPQQQILNTLFERANEKNEGLVTFDVTSEPPAPVPLPGNLN